MKISAVGRVARTTAVVTCLTAWGTSFADCQSARPATSSDIAGGQAGALLKSMVTACKSQDEAKFFGLQSNDVNKVLSQRSSADKKKLFGQYCAFTADAVNGLGGSLEAAVHSVGPYKNRTKCDYPVSYWFVHNKSGDLVLRLEVAVESGRLKIDTQ